MPGVKKTEDKALQDSLRKGDADALKTVYDKYKAAMLAVAMAMVPDRPTAEDVVHDVFVSFARIARSLKIKEDLKSYLLTSIVNRIRNINKSGNHRVASIGNMESVDPQAFLPDPLSAAPTDAERLKNALAALPDSQSEVIILHLMEGLKFRTIAKSQGKSIHTVQSRYRYGMRKMRAYFAEENENV